MNTFQRTLAHAALWGTLLASPAAHAQQWMMSGAAAAASGLEGGGGRTGSMGRAQTRLRVGGDLAIDESPENVVGGAVLVAVEPRAAFGLDLRYSRVVRERLALSGGVVGYLQPGSLVGPVAAVELRFPVGKTFVLTTGPELDVFVVGTDLPDRTVLWQALFNLGTRVAF